MGASELSLELMSLSSKFTLEDSSVDQSLMSDSEFKAKLNYKWLFSTRVHLIFSLSQEVYSFKSRDSSSSIIAISQDESLRLSEFEVGVRFVISPKSALSISSVNRDELVLTQEDSSLYEFSSKEINFFRLKYNQVLIQFRFFNIGFSGFYDTEVSEEDLDSRSAFGGRIYSVIGRSAHRLRVAYGKSITAKNLEVSQVKQENSLASLEYIYRFK